MIVTIGKQFSFDAAHRIPDHKGKCRFLHGHTYTLSVELTGEVNPDTHMLVDFYDLREVVDVILENSDHDNLNNKYPITTVEHLSADFAAIIHRAFPTMGVTVQLQEGTGGYARCTILPPAPEVLK